MAPPFLFIDELDVVAPARSGNSSDIYSKEIVGQLLQEMDGILRENSHIFILAATMTRMRSIQRFSADSPSIGTYLLPTNQVALNSFGFI